ncbi:cobalamin biosynthesis protein CobW [Actinomycetaceae bacterium TAE3-ERU4]|nr:cobalamin biosynthesis protein CobW [Actinomycetaceae bacterium TAE3-ERU4]
MSLPNPPHKHSHEGCENLENGGEKYQISLLGALDPALLELAEFTLSGGEHQIFNIFMNLAEEGEIKIAPGGLFAMSLPTESEYSATYHLQTPCLTCALRQALIDFFVPLAAQHPGGKAAVILPAGIELAHLCPGLEEELAESGQVELTGTAHLIGTDDAPQTLLTHLLLNELCTGKNEPRAAALAIDDQRCAAEVHTSNLAYADAAVLVGDAGPGWELVEHLIPADCLIIPGLAEPILKALEAIKHDSALSLERAHPVTYELCGGPTQNGTWTLDLHSDRPFHPERLREMAAELGGQGCLVRGCFWLPSRPTEIFVWEAVDGVVSLGQGGSWAEMEESPRSHLIVTGIGDSRRRESFIEAFSRVLLSEEEMALALGWVGREDGLGDWITQEEE